MKNFIVLQLIAALYWPIWLYFEEIGQNWTGVAFGAVTVSMLMWLYYRHITKNFNKE